MFVSVPFSSVVSFLLVECASQNMSLSLYLFYLTVSQNNNHSGPPCPYIYTEAYMWAWMGAHNRDYLFVLLPV